MAQARVGHRRAIAVALFVAMASLILAGVGQRPAGAEVTAVQGSAFGYQANFTIFGGGPFIFGPTPMVTLPSTGSPVPITDTDESGRVAQGPGVLFTSGPLTVSTQGTTGTGGSVNTTSNIVDVPTSTVGEILYAGSIDTACTASETGVSGTTTITGPGDAGRTSATLRTSDGDPDVEGDETYYDIPLNPAPNTTVQGNLESVGDTYTVVFNEQTVNPDGSITVTAVHEILNGPTALGNLYIGQVVCGVTSVPDTTTSTTEPPTTLPGGTTTTLPGGTTTTLPGGTTTTLPGGTTTTLPGGTTTTLPGGTTTTLPGGGDDCGGLTPTVTGTPGPDNITGTPGPDVIVGGGGDDIISGLGGDDTICGQGGDDTIRGRAGNDTLRGGPGNDQLEGGNGNDDVSGGSGDDDARGQEGDDQVSGNEGADTVTGGAGDDFVSGGDDNDNVHGNDGDDQVEGNSGDDRVLGGAGNDNLEGNGGADTLNAVQGDGGLFADTLTGGPLVDQCFSDPSDTPASLTGADC